MSDLHNSYFDDEDLNESSDSGMYDDEWNYFNANADGDLDTDVLDDIDFSELRGKSFKSNLNRFNQTYKQRERKKYRLGKKPAPLTKRFGVQKRATIVGGKSTNKDISRVIVPNDRKVIVEGVDGFILDKQKMCDGVKNIGYYNCKKLKELIIIMNNDSPNDFNLELFNPSMPMDYLFANSGNLNNKVTVAGGVVSYSDVLFNLLANPTHIVNAKFSYAGTSSSIVANQIAQSLIFKNKRIDGYMKVEPLNTQLQLDIYQFQPNILFFDFQSALNRPFIPDGMDVIQYKVLAGASVTFSFYYRQKSLKRFFLKEARETRRLL
jgi:hypothetical protein